MEKITEMSVDNIKRGFRFQPEAGRYVCAVCGKGFETGEIFNDGGRYFDAGCMIGRHVREEHGRHAQRADGAG